jgi:hypothetical protein
VLKKKNLWKQKNMRIKRKLIKINQPKVLKKEPKDLQDNKKMKKRK